MCAKESMAARISRLLGPVDGFRSVNALSRSGPRSHVRSGARRNIWTSRVSSSLDPILRASWFRHSLNSGSAFPPT